MLLELSLHLLSLLGPTPRICETQGKSINGDPHGPYLNTGELEATFTHSQIKYGKPSLNLEFSDSFKSCFGTRQHGDSQPPICRPPHVSPTSGFSLDHKWSHTHASGHSTLHLQAPPTHPASTRTPASPNSCLLAISQPSGCAHSHHGLPSAGRTWGRGSGRVQNRLGAIWTEHPWASDGGGARLEVDISPQPGRRLRREARVGPFGASG